MEQLKSRRTVIKRSVTYFTTFLNNFNSISDNVTNLKLRLEKIEDLWSKFDDVQGEIEEMNTEPDSEQQRVEFENKYFDAVTKAREIIAQISPPLTTPTLTNNDTPQVVSTSKTQLPILKLPIFNGDFIKWLSFKDSFVATIHENNSLSEVDKFRHLRNLLQGDPLDLISSLSTSNENYGIAWQYLCDRYENEKIIIHTHMKAIFDMPSISKDTYLRQTIDSFQIHLSALRALNEPIEHWDTMLIYLLCSKIDGKSRKDWENKNSGINGKPKFKDFIQFLSSRCQVIEISERMYKTEINKSPGLKRNISLATNTITKNCSFCRKPKHFIFNCFKFLKLPVEARIDEVKRLKLCCNCLRPGHQGSECRGKGCAICGNSHNSVLHTGEPINFQPTTYEPESVNKNIVTCKAAIKRDNVLLPTTLVKLYNSTNNKSYIVRALLDSGSQSNFINKDLVNKLNLKSAKININVNGLNGTLSKTSNKCNLTLHSLNSHYSKTISCLVINNITDDIPAQSLNIDDLNIPKNIQLADASFYECKPIDLLLGATFFFEIIQSGKIFLGKDKPIMQQTLLGWIVAGATSNAPATNVKTYLCTDTKELQKQLEQFWQVEELSTESTKYSREEEECLKHFEESTRRDHNGRFIVKMPLKNTNLLGNSLDIAISRLRSMERKFKQNPDIKSQYTKFMKEYEETGHMERVSKNNSQGTYYLPHHCVIREESITTKLRVVFDGSAMPSTGLSLNQIQKVGPTIQRDLFAIMLNFRRHLVALTADVEKMYRQVLIDKSQRHLQQIVWREDENDPISHYQLKTVTYGQAAAPFLAIRSLVQLAITNKNQYPKASEIIQDDFYVDDLISGANTEVEAFKRYQELTEILETACMPLRKWNSNSSTLLNLIGKTNEAQDSAVYICQDVCAKTLGIRWHPRNDNFIFSVNFANDKLVTKRTVVSEMSKIYDPLGLISPVKIIAKTFVQRLWQEKISWDEPLNRELCTEWQNFIFSTKQLNNLEIPRYILCEETKRIELHCFCDASEKAYAACTYIKTINHKDKSFVHLLCSKTRVAPLKTLSIPRLELCGAWLLSKLVKRVKQCLKVDINEIFYWTDSTVVLCWLNTSPHLLKSFVAHRVTEINNLTNEDSWQHVPTKQNPADIASRGAYADTLQTSNLWWYGPNWLLSDKSNWPQSRFTITELPELKDQSKCFSNVKTETSILDRYSNLGKLQRVVAYVLRFKTNCLKERFDRDTGPLLVPELEASLQSLIRQSQKIYFKDEIKNLINNKPLSKRSKLGRLNPFLDKNSILRVGGRLDNSEYQYEKKHPIILSSSCSFTKLLMSEEHLKLLHSTSQQLLYHIREKYWPIGGRNLARKIVKQCLKCFKAHPQVMQNLMGNLPGKRLKPTYPFSVTGVDYAGPFLIKDRKGRKPNLIKCYVCLFVCFVSRAMHLELVTDLTVDGFLKCLRRFAARRGMPSQIFSDNGTNFIGTNNKLKEVGKFLQTYESELAEVCAQQSIEWHFIPAYSPHFGGLWEAGVRSVKHHLRRVLGDTKLVFEDFNTILIQIESILNSRPMSVLSSDPNDPIPLTPGHFLIGRSLNTLLDRNFRPIPTNRLTNYQQLQQLMQHFWTRWSKEFISELQERQKWKVPYRNLQRGDIVLIKDDKVPPLQWILGSIIETHPGADGIVRVATLRLPSGQRIQRSICKLCLLPNQVQ